MSKGRHVRSAGLRSPHAVLTSAEIQAWKTKRGGTSFVWTPSVLIDFGAPAHPTDLVRCEARLKLPGRKSLNFDITFGADRWFDGPIGILPISFMARARDERLPHSAVSDSLVELTFDGDIGSGIGTTGFRFEHKGVLVRRG